MQTIGVLMYYCQQKTDVKKATKPILVVALRFTMKQCRITLERSMQKYIPENHSHSTCVKLLIGAGTDVNMADNQGFTPLINATLQDHDDCIDLLIKAGASIAPIIETALSGTPKCLQKLIAAGADVNAIRYRGRAVVMECVWKSKKWWDEITKASEQSYFPRNCKQKECLEILIAAGANVNVKTDGGISVLMKASQNGYEECAK